MEQIYHDPLDSFTDREQIVKLFEQFLCIAHPGQLRFLAIKGNSGTGKTFLISYLTTLICPKLGWKSGQLGFAQSLPNFRAILAALEVALKECVPHPSLDQFRKQRDEYNDSFDEYASSITINQTIEAQQQSSLSGVEMHVGVTADLHKRELHLRADGNMNMIWPSRDGLRSLNG